jgi:hypothetical protein
MPFILTELSDWWPRILGLLMFLLAAFGGWRAWVSLRADQLKDCRTEIKNLKGDLARLLREATVRIDNEQAYLAEIDALQIQVTEQRERISRLIDDNSGRKQDSKDPGR